MKYKAVGFDYGGVLAGPPAHMFGTEMSELLGIDKNKYDELYYARYRDMNLGKVTWFGVWKDILKELGQEEKFPNFLEIDERYHHKRDLNQPVVELAKQLKQQGYKVGILSNNSLRMAVKMHKEMSDIFEVIQVSAETGYVKPDPAGFRHFTDALGVKLTELVFIDDAENSLKTAKQCGFKDILFTDYDQLVLELRSLKII